jgi:4a-hydroxytetrahydrobiopterin dehydratase
MTQLCEKSCEPCQGGVEPLTGEDLKTYAQQVPDWEIVDEHHLKRTFDFPDFQTALGFVNRIGELAEQQGHHPNIWFTWGKVTVELLTHKIDGLHENDFILASKIDQLPRPS